MLLQHVHVAAFNAADLAGNAEELILGGSRAEREATGTERDPAEPKYGPRKGAGECY